MTLYGITASEMEFVRLYTVWQLMSVVRTAAEKCLFIKKRKGKFYKRH